MDAQELLTEYRRLYAAGLISDEEFERQVGRLESYRRFEDLEREGVGALFRIEASVLPRILGSQVFWVVLLLALMPLLLAVLRIAPDEGMTLYFAFLWFFLFLRLFRLEVRGSRPLDFVMVVALVVVPGLVALLPALHVLLAPLYDLLTAPQLPVRWIGFVFGVGVAEETVKLLPVLVTLALARRAGRRLGLEASILLGVAAGLAFAGFENILYSQQFGMRWWGVAYARSDVVLSRLLMTPFLHSVWTGSAAFAVGAALAFRPFSIVRLARVALPMFWVAVVLHGTYDALSLSPLLAAVMGGMSYFILVLVVAAAKRWEGRGPHFLDDRVV